MSDNNILYLGKLNNGVQLDFVTGNLTHISGFTGDIQAAVLQQTVDNSTTGKAVASKGVYDFVTGVSGYLSENSNDTLYNLTGEDGALTNSSKITLTAENNLGETDTSVTLLGGQDISISNNGSTITIAHSGTTSASSSYNSADSVINGVGIDGRGHVTGFTTTGLDGRYYTETEINTKLTNTGNWDTAYDRSITGVDFNISDGNLTLQKQDGSTIVESLEGRYLTSYTETQTLDDVVTLGSTTDKGITVRNISIADGSDGASEISATGGDLTLDSAGGTVIVDDNIFIKGNATISGDLLVSGTTTTVNSSVTTISDPILTLGSGTIAADDGKDRGIEFIYYDGGIKTGFFGYDNEDSRFAFFTGATNSSENFVGIAAPFDLSATVDDSTIKYDNAQSHLYIPTSGITNTQLYYDSLGVTAGSGLANGGTVSLGGSTTLDIGGGNGITVNADSIEVSGYHGITVDANGVSVSGYHGITVDASGVSVTGYQGISVGGNGVSTVSDQSHLNKIEIGADQTNLDSVTNTTYGGVKVVRARSTGITAVDLTEDGSVGDAISVAADSTLTFEGIVGVRNEDADNADGAESAAWKIMGVLERDSDSGNMILSQVTTIAKGANATNWSISLSASSSGLSLQGNGEDAHNLVWSATLNYNVITA